VVNAKDAPGGAPPPLRAHLLCATRLFLGDCPIPERSWSGRAAHSWVVRAIAALLGDERDEPADDPPRAERIAR
jgi:hypothetical protein